MNYLSFIRLILGLTILSGFIGFVPIKLNTKAANLKLQKQVLTNDKAIGSQFLAGQKVAELFLRQCSLLTGKIENIDNQQVEFTVYENLWTSGKRKKESESKFVIPVKDFRLDSESSPSWKDLTLQLGRKLIVSECPKSNNIEKRIELISDKIQILPSIKEIVFFHSKYRENVSSLQVYELFKDPIDYLFVGYIATFLSRGGFVIDQDKAAMVLAKLFEIPQIPDNGKSFITLTLRHLLNKVGKEALESTTQDFIFSELLQLGSSDNKEVEQVFWLFLTLAEKDQLNIKPYLNKENRSKIIKNYRIYANKFNASPKARQNFEKQLASIPQL